MYHPICKNTTKHLESIDEDGGNITSIPASSLPSDMPATSLDICNSDSKVVVTPLSCSSQVEMWPSLPVSCSNSQHLLCS